MFEDFLRSFGVYNSIYVQKRVCFNPSAQFGNAHLAGVVVYYKLERVLVYILLTLLIYNTYYLGK